MQIVFMGTSDFALPALRTLDASCHQIVLVVTQPDKPKGRGLRLSPPTVKNLALSLNLPVIQPLKIKDPSLIQQLQALKPEIILVVAYGQFLPKEILDIPKYGCVNLHPSLLPQYRGPSPIPAAILQGEEKTGVTTMFIGEGMDAGPILLQKEIEIKPADTAASLHNKLAVIGANLLLETIDGLENGKLSAIPQSEELATYTAKLNKENGQIDWRKAAQQVHNQVRAMNPWPGAYTFYGDAGYMLKVWQTRIYFPEKIRTGGEPGEILEVSDEGIGVQTGDYPLLIIEVQRAGGQRMAVREFLRGHPLCPGTKLA